MFSSILACVFSAAVALRAVPTMTQTTTRHAVERILGGASAAVATAALAYDLPDLPYPYEALEPSIDAATMKIHHDKHHATYVAGLNSALEGKDQPPIADLMKGAIKGGVKGVRNSGGGVYNHDFFWQVMASKGSGGAPSEKLAAAIDKQFGSMDGLKEQWGAAAAPAARFGSGWVWLIVDGNTLKITSTPNQDNPLMDGVDGTKGIPILGIDVWEHACVLCVQTESYLFLRPATTSSTRTVGPNTWRPGGTSSTGIKSTRGTRMPSLARLLSSKHTRWTSLMWSTRSCGAPWCRPGWCMTQVLLLVPDDADGVHPLPFGIERRGDAVAVKFSLSGGHRVHQQARKGRRLGCRRRRPGSSSEAGLRARSAE